MEQEGHMLQPQDGDRARVRQTLGTLQELEHIAQDNHQEAVVASNLGGNGWAGSKEEAHRSEPGTQHHSRLGA